MGAWLRLLLLVVVVAVVFFAPTRLALPGAAERLLVAAAVVAVEAAAREDDDLTIVVAVVFVEDVVLVLVARSWRGTAGDFAGCLVAAAVLEAGFFVWFFVCDCGVGRVFRGDIGLEVTPAAEDVSLPAVRARALSIMAFSGLDGLSGDTGRVKGGCWRGVLVGDAVSNGDCLYVRELFDFGESTLASASRITCDTARDGPALAGPVGATGLPRRFGFSSGMGASTATGAFSLSE